METLNYQKIGLLWHWREHVRFYSFRSRLTFVVRLPFHAAEEVGQEWHQRVGQDHQENRVSIVTACGDSRIGSGMGGCR